MKTKSASRVANSPGYEDPDFKRTNAVTTKIDVYWWVGGCMPRTHLMFIPIVSLLPSCIAGVLFMERVSRLAR